MIKTQGEFLGLFLWDPGFELLKQDHGPAFAHGLVVIPAFGGKDAGRATILTGTVANHLQGDIYQL